MNRWPVALLVVVAGSAQAGELVSFAKNGTVTSSYAVNWIKSTFKAPFNLPASSPPIDVYRIKYRSRSVVGKPVVLSGMVALPKGGSPKGVVVFFHGTTADRQYVPSRYNCKDTPSESEVSTIIFGSGGYAVFAPDYLGLGDDFSFHPYALGSINCWSGIDMIEAGRALVGRLKASVGPKLYVSGYSEGGAVAMWAIRLLDKSTVHDLTAGAPLSGPYDLSGAQAQTLISNQSNPELLAVRVYFGAYFGLGVQRNFPQYSINLDQYFVPSFASYIPLVFDRNYSDETLAKTLAIKALQLGTFRSIKSLLTSRYVQAMQAVDVADPMVGQTVANNCFDWAPSTPMLLVHLYNDFMVAPQNTLNAVTAMRKRGVGTDIMRSYTIMQRGLTHMTAGGPAAVMARKFFDSGYSGVPGPLN